MQGALAGLLGCILGVIGIFAFGFVFVPLAAACALVGLIRGFNGRSAAGIGTSLLAGALSVFGYITSPSLWLLTAGMFLALSISGHQSSPIAAPAPPKRAYVSLPAPTFTLDQAVVQAKTAIETCGNERRTGELKTYVASAKCALPGIIDAYQRINYRHLDLIFAFAERRIVLAQEIDEGRLSEAQASEEMERFSKGLIEQEHQRDRESR